MPSKGDFRRQVQMGASIVVDLEFWMHLHPLKLVTTYLLRTSLIDDLMIDG